jgi:hypothetical protein
MGDDDADTPPAAPASPSVSPQRVANVAYANALMDTEIGQRNSRKDSQEGTARWMCSRPAKRPVTRAKAEKTTRLALRLVVGHPQIERHLHQQHYLLCTQRTIPRVGVRRYPDKPMSGHAAHDWWYRCLTTAGIVAPGTTSGEKMHKSRHTAGQRVLDATDSQSFPPSPPQKLPICSGNEDSMETVGIEPTSVIACEWLLRA